MAILDADRAGFLRSQTSLIQIAGRAARNVDGEVILYADEATPAIRNAIDEGERRRKIQMEYNEQHDITPATINKAIHNLIDELATDYEEKPSETTVPAIPVEANLEEIQPLIAKLTKEMQVAAVDLEFERAAALRDQIAEIKREFADL